MAKKKIATKKEKRAWEERRDKRFEEENKVIIEWDQYRNPKRSNAIYAFTKDIALAGAKILTDINFPLDTLLTINLTLSRSKKVIKVAANVKWVKPVFNGDLYEVGLEFIHDYPQTLSILIRHLFGEEFPQDVSLEMSKAQSRTI
ncbi:PilZ domain-containing protein [Acidobacteriota bacterium]